MTVTTASASASASAPAMAAVSYSGKNAGGGGGSDFIVHIEHICNKCFQRPILGRRYTSDVISNFNLCASCFESIAGPVFGFTETALVDDMKLSRDFVLKLKIDNGDDVQVRRMKVESIWDKSNSSLSLSRLLTAAAGFASDVPARREVLLTTKAKTTYLDGEGDTIYVSLDEELKDAFLQVLAALPVRKSLFVNVTFPKAGMIYSSTEARMAGLSKLIQVGNVGPNKNKVTSGLSKRIQVENVGHNNKVTSVSMTKALSKRAQRSTMNDRLRKFNLQDFYNPSFIHTLHTCNGCSMTPIIGTRYHATKMPGFDLCALCFVKYEGDKDDFRPEIQARKKMLRINPEDFSNDFFVHARHTCNGCSTTPIIGTRYHSKKVPDVDLCASCFTKYEGDKRDFMPEIQVCDVQMQENCENWDMAACLKKFQETNSSGLESKKSFSTKFGNVEFVFRKKYDYLQIVPGDITNEFFVHARHACNGCSVTPIIGPRYHSTKMPDVDLCALCFVKYEGDKLDFTPEILVRDLLMQRKLKNWDLPACLKMFQDSTIRDIGSKSASPLVGKVESESKKKTLGITSGDFSNEFFVHARHTCNGCSVTPIIGTRYHSTKVPDVDFCASCFAKYESNKHDFTPTIQVCDIRMQRKYKNWVPSEIQGNMANLTACLKRFQDSNNRKKDSSSVNKEFFVHARHACNGCAMTPIIGTRYHSTKVPDVDLCETCFTKYDGDKLGFMPEIQVRDRRMQEKYKNWVPSEIQGNMANLTACLKKFQESPHSGVVEPVHKQKTPSASMTGKSPAVARMDTTLQINPRDFNNEFFVHARHACNGCSTTPIVGVRYHATKVPDVDLCEACFAKYEGDDLGFTSEVQVRDLPLQQKWCKNWVPSEIAPNMASLVKVLKKVQESSRGSGFEMSNTGNDSKSEVDGWNVVEDDNGVSDWSVSSDVSPLVLAEWDFED